MARVGLQDGACYWVAPDPGSLGEPVGCLVPQDDGGTPSRKWDRVTNPAHVKVAGLAFDLTDHIRVSYPRCNSTGVTKKVVMAIDFALLTVWYS